MITAVLTFIVVLGALIFVHEFGHFFLAKKAGIKVEEFGFGYPPRIFGIKVGETIYSINALPFGGFVRIYGQDQEVEEDVGRSFYGQNKWVRSFVLIGGIVMNLITGCILFTIVYGKSGVPVETNNLRVVGITQNSPAAEAGIEPGDQVLEIRDGQEKTKINSTDTFIKTIDENKGEKITLKIKRGEETFYIETSLRTDEQIPENDGSLGVMISTIEMKHYVWWKMPFLAMKAGVSESFAWVVRVFQGLGITFKQLFAGESPQVTGPVGMYKFTKQAAEQGLLTVLRFTGILSINLAVLNLLPIPALDGGRLFFVGVEAVIGKKKSRKIEQHANAVGMILLLALMILITINDIIGLGGK